MNEQLTKLIEQVKAIHELTIDACDMCGGTYEENLDGAEAYFTLGDTRFVISITRR